jgi:Mlc titration factor MtfA (ptsG expression regulator)
VPLQQQHPDLYSVLAEFYRQDPAARVRRCRPGPTATASG